MDVLSIIERDLNEVSKLKMETYPYDYLGDLSRYKIFNYDAKNLKNVVEASSLAYKEYSKFTSYEKTNILFRAAELLEKNKEKFAEIISLEANKPIKFSLQEVDRSIQTLKLSAIEASKLEGEQLNLDVAENGGGREAYTKLESIGIVYAMTPFNFPLNLALHKVGPALAIGNTVILKPSEKTPFSSYLLKEILVQSGLPKDVLQIVTGDGEAITNQLLSYEDIKKISFTGSYKVGTMIKSKVDLRAITLELGSTSPVYISSQVDNVEEIAERVVVGAFSYNGQVCISTQKVFVDEKIYEEFINYFVEKTNKLKYGPVLEADTDYSDLIDINSQTRIIDWIQEAKDSGANILTGGEKINLAITPTIITNANQNLKVCTEEIFGPVVVVEKVSCDEDITQLLNQSDYGLNAGIFTNNLKVAMKLANELNYGQVLINDIPTLRFDHMPYNGRKNSGYGTEGIKYAIKEMSKLKMVSIAYE